MKDTEITVVYRKTRYKCRGYRFPKLGELYYDPNNDVVRRCTGELHTCCLILEVEG